MPTINMMPRIETTLVHGYPGAGPCGEKDPSENAYFFAMTRVKSGEEKRARII